MFIIFILILSFRITYLYYRAKFIASLSQREVWRECKYSCPVGIKKEKSIDFAFLCRSVTDYRTIVEDFYKVVEFVEWVKEYYPEKITQFSYSK